MQQRGNVCATRKNQIVGKIISTHQEGRQAVLKRGRGKRAVIDEKQNKICKLGKFCSLLRDAATRRAAD